MAVDHAFGGVTGHSFDLMALDSNAVMGKDGKPFGRTLLLTQVRVLQVSTFSVKI